MTPVGGNKRHGTLLVQQSALQQPKGVRDVKSGPHREEKIGRMLFSFLSDQTAAVCWSAQHPHRSTKLNIFPLSLFSCSSPSTSSINDPKIGKFKAIIMYWKIVSNYYGTQWWWQWTACVWTVFLFVSILRKINSFLSFYFDIPPLRLILGKHIANLWREQKGSAIASTLLESAFHARQTLTGDLTI